MALKFDNNGDEDIVSEINMTPLIDIMLVLLILFMVTSSVSLESGLDINLPKTSSQTKKAGPKAVIVSLSKEGVISVMGKKVNYEDLEISIGESLKTAEAPMVIFEGDENSTLGKTIEIMDIAKKAGAEKFAIAAESQ